jgi:hypothetical protein
MSRLLRLVATALALAFVVFLLAGCGEETTTTAAQTVTSKASKSAGTSTSKAEDLVGQVVTPGELTPPEFKNALAARRPIVVTFYMSGPYDDSQVHQSIISLESKYRGKVDFFDYLYTDGQKFGDLAIILKISTTPSVVVINCQSQVQRAWSGFADGKSLEQGIVEATKTGCGGSSSGGGTTTGSRTSTTGTGTSTTAGSSTTGSGDGSTD